MKVKTAKGGWGACFGVLGVLTLAGVATTVTARPAAEAQTPPVRTPEQIYNRACGRCHADGEDAPDLHNKRQTVVQMTKQIREGSAKMRAIPTTRLSDADLASMMTYLRSIHAVR